MDGWMDGWMRGMIVDSILNSTFETWLQVPVCFQFGCSGDFKHVRERKFELMSTGLVWKFFKYSNFNRQQTTVEIGGTRETQAYVRAVCSRAQGMH